MTIDLMSLRAIFLSPDMALRELVRKAASSCVLPIEIEEAADVASARQAITAGAELVYIDGTGVPEADVTALVSTIRSGPRPPFTVLLAAGGAAAPFATDGLAGRPSRLEEAKWLLDRSMRVRLPSRALVVDDSSTMRAIIRKALAGTRFPLDVSEADQGLEALKLLRESDFDILFLDYNMPDFNGIETLAELKRERRNVNVVMISSSQDEELADRARTLGAAFLKKPFFPADIEAVLSRFYGLRALNARRF